MERHEEKMWISDKWTIFMDGRIQQYKEVNVSKTSSWLTFENLKTYFWGSLKKNKVYEYQKIIFLKKNKKLKEK